MATSRTSLALPGLLLSLAGACEQEPEREPSWLFRGQWIDVDGIDRTAEETCAGTFEYLDRYAGAVAAEFGVDQHLGVYHWYSREIFKRENLCDGASGCERPGEIESHLMPLDHELVHLANDAAATCPSPLAEGLAAYYSTFEDEQADDFEALAAALAQPSKQLPYRDYAVAGRFAAFLVETFGLDAVLEVCSRTGFYPDSASFAAAMEDVLGSSPAELVDELAQQPPECNVFSRYQSRVYACGLAAAAPHAGVVGDEYERYFDMRCDAHGVVGPLVEPDGKTIRVVMRIEFATAGAYQIYFWGENSGIFHTPAQLTFARCAPCGDITLAYESVTLFDFEAGSYWLEIRAPADFDDVLKLKIIRSP